MHELGLVYSVIHNLEKLADEQKIKEIGSVTVEIGEVSGVVPEYIADCWNYAHVKHEVLKNASLRVLTLPAVTYCEDCGKTYSTVQFKKQCPYCKSEHTYLLKGREFNIKEIEAR
jgi:hydrogenase nickel incorporation protein HypA/HybF